MKKKQRVCVAADPDEEIQNTTENKNKTSNSIIYFYIFIVRSLYVLLQYRNE